MVTRRDFLKLTGVSAAAGAASLVGLRSPGLGVAHFLGAPRVVSTLCPGCPAGCALQVQVAGERVLDVQANSGHPLACRGACDGLETALRDLGSPQRLRGPLRRSAGRGASFQRMDWPAASALLAHIFTSYQAGQIAFVLSDFPNHLSDLVHRLALALGGATVLRYSPSSLFDGRVTLQDAARRLFGLPRLPYFDLPNAALVYAFSASGEEPWLARYANPSGRPPDQAWVHFAPARPAFAAPSDQWVSIRPGGEALLAQALGRLLSLIQSGVSLERDLPPEIAAADQATGVSPAAMLDLARRFAAASSAVALPGANCLGQSGGLAAAQSVLALDVIAGRLGRPGGLYLQPEAPLYPELSGRTATLAELGALLGRIESGQIKALFVHGVDLIAGLPASLDAARALDKIERLVSFNSLANETSPYAGVLLPDHLPLENWGYQKISPAADRTLVSAIQPLFPPRYDTRSTVDVLLDAIQHIGAPLAAQFPYRSQGEFLRRSVARLPWDSGSDPWSRWVEQGGWWRQRSDVLPPVSLLPPQQLHRHAPAPWPLDETAGEFYLVFAPSPADADSPFFPPAGPCPVSMHPQAAGRLGLHPGDRVRLASPSAEIEAQVVLQPGIRPDTLAIPLLPNRLGNPHALDLLGGQQNESGDLAYQSGRVRLISATV